tara:strand:- start:3285 stop:5096 length:1812 start_codon:yes stop_codon:yes gene_type:complete
MANWKRILSEGDTLDDLGGGSGSTFLRKDGTWATPTDTTYSVGAGGLTQQNFTSTLKNKLDAITGTNTGDVCTSNHTSAGYITSFTNTVDMGDGFKIANSSGTDQFTVTENEEIRFAGSGATSVAFDSSTQKITISSTDNNTTYSVGAGGLTQQNFTTTLKNKLDAVVGTNTGDVCTTNHANAGYLTSQTDSQTLSVSGTTVSISGGNSITTQDTNTQLSTADVRGKISASGNSSYNSSTGVITSTNTQLSDAQVRSKFSGGTNVTINSSGVIATSANNYVLPTNLAGDDINVDTGALTGATVISDLDFNITTNTSGLVTDANGTVATRTLTLANLGYSGAVDANNFTYSLPAGSSSTRGGFKIGFSESGKNYPVEVSSEKMYVNVPWTDTTQTTISGNAGSATVLANTRTFRIKLDSTAAVNFNGSANVTPGIQGTLGVSNGGTGLTSISTLLNSNVTAVSGSSGTFTSTTQNSQFNSIGVGVAGSTTAGEIRATNEVTAYYSDDRLKTKSGNIKNALDKVISLNGFHYKPNKVAGKLGYDTSVKKVGVSAQEVLKVLPEAVVPAPINPKYHTVQYEKLIPLLIESIKELNAKVKRLENGDN